MIDHLECGICGTSDRDVRVGLVQWVADPGQFDSVPRCSDRAACAERVWHAGRPWPVIERDHSNRSLYLATERATAPPPLPAPSPPVPAGAPIVDDPESWW